MSIIRVSCLPNMSEKELRVLFESIVLATEAVSDLHIKKGEGRNLFTVLFPPDSMRYGLGLDVVIEVIGLEELADITPATRRQLSSCLVSAVAQHCPAEITRKIKCFVFPWDMNSSEFASLDTSARKNALMRRRQRAVEVVPPGFP